MKNLKAFFYLVIVLLLFIPIRSYSATAEKIDGIEVELFQNYSATSPVYKCIECGGYHGGAFGDLCWWCYLKAELLLDFFTILL
ncbi:MAG: hypothetical protein Q4E16_03505 [Neisseria sp.]|nr:hypothetical protein [Neisseria sp.]